MVIITSRKLKEICIGTWSRRSQSNERARVKARRYLLASRLWILSSIGDPIIWGGFVTRLDLIRRKRSDVIYT